MTAPTTPISPSRIIFSAIRYDNDTHGATFPLSIVGRLGYITSPPTRSQFSHRNHRYYVPLRLPLPISGRFAFAPFPIPCCRLLLCSTVPSGSTPSRCNSVAARALDLPVPQIFRLLESKETVGSPKFVSCPSMHMPRSRIPVVSHRLACCAFGTAAFHINHCVGFPRSRGLSFQTTICNYFGILFRGLRTRFPSASHTLSQGSHFGSATSLLARLWLGGILTRWATSTNFNAYRHLPTFHVSLGTRAKITGDEEMLFNRNP